MAEADWDNEVEQMQQEEAPPAPFVAEPVEIKLFNRYFIVVCIPLFFSMLSAKQCNKQSNFSISLGLLLYTIHIQEKVNRVYTLK